RSTGPRWRATSSSRSEVRPRPGARRRPAGGGGAGGRRDPGVLVAAVATPWNVVPNERDAINHMEFDPLATHLHTVVYRRYARGFARPLPNPYGGIPGPLLHARVGDRILVHFRNLDFDAPHSMHFHGVRYRPSSDGAYLPGFSGPDAKVMPGSS